MDQESSEMDQDSTTFNTAAPGQISHEAATYGQQLSQDGDSFGQQATKDSSVYVQQISDETYGQGAGDGEFEYEYIQTPQGTFRLRKDKVIIDFNFTYQFQ
jgi:hypothetical protein